jgi:hypothetical protein
MNLSPQILQALQKTLPIIKNTKTFYLKKH